jgi:O-antigen/teichoic acid export membrane protein
LGRSLQKDWARVLRGEVSIVAAGQVFQQVLTLATGILVARMLGSAGYGLVNLLRTVFQMLATLAPLGLDLALLKYCGRDSADEAQVLATIRRLRIVSLFVNVAAALIIALGFGGLLREHVYPFEGFEALLFATLVALPFAADLAIVGAYYRARGLAGTYALMTLYLQPAARAVLLGLAYWLWPTVMAVVLINTVQVGLSAIALSGHDIGRRRRLALHAAPGEGGRTWAEARGVLRESVWMSLNLFVYGAMRFVDILMLGSLAPAKEVGEYGALSTIAQLVQVYPLAASQSLGPDVSRHYHAGNMDGVRQALGSYIHKASIVASFIFAGIAAFGTRLDLLFGPSFQFRWEVSILMPLGYLLSATLAPTGYALSMTGRHRGELGILGLGSVVLVAFCALLIPPYGQVGAAAAVAIAFLIVNLVRYGYVARVLGFVPGHPRDLLPPFVALALAFAARGATDLLGERSLLVTAAGCVLYAILYGAAAWAFLWRKPTGGTGISGETA